MFSAQFIERRVIYTYDNYSNSMVEKNNTIENLTPLTATKDNCNSGWIRAVNELAPRMHAQNFKIDLKTAEKCGYQGKWIIPFTKEDPKIIEIWEKVREAVQIGIFCEAKVSIPSDDFAEQVILVYTIDHTCKEDVSLRLKALINRGIITDSKIFYKTESATLKNLDEYKYSSEDFPKQTKRISAVVFSIFKSFFTLIGNAAHSLGMRFFNLFSTSR